MRTGLKKKRNTIVLSKLGIICISVIMLMNIIGVGYGSWNSGIEVQSIISTGSIDPVFVECEIEEKEERNNNESEETDTRLSDEDMESSELEELEELEAKEEEASYARISDDKKRMDVFIKNAYPGYKAKIEYRIENNGTIPILCEVECESIEYINVDIEEPQGPIYGFGNFKEGTIEIELDKGLEKEPDKKKDKDSDKQKRRGEQDEEDNEDSEDTVDYEFSIDLTFRQYNIVD